MLPEQGDLNIKVLLLKHGISPFRIPKQAIETVHSVTDQIAPSSRPNHIMDLRASLRLLLALTTPQSFFNISAALSHSIASLLHS